MHTEIQYFHYTEAFQLENLQQIAGLTLAYHTYGTLNAAKNNVIWVFHAFTANSDCLDWWQALFENNPTINPSEHFIVCVNMPGSCYGSTGPLSINPQTNTPYFYDFPQFSIKDIARSFALLHQYLQLGNIYLGIGGSMGGQVLLAWTVMQPRLFINICILATNARHSAYGIAYNATQRAAIANDKSWGEWSAKAGLEGMKIARAIALLSYRTYESYTYFQSGKMTDESTYKAESYQKYQGEKLAQRFNAFSYYFLSKSMDSHCLGATPNDIIDKLANITAKTLVLAIENDMLFPIQEQRFLADHIEGAQLKVLNSIFGHDGFLLETQQIKNKLKSFLLANQ